MNELRKLQLQQEATAKKIADQIAKDTAILSEDLEAIAKESGRELKDIISLIETAIALSETTNKSIYQLLELDEPVKVIKKSTAKDSEWAKYKKDNDNVEHILPDGTVFTLRKMGRNNSLAEAAYHEGTLKKA